MPGPLSSKVQHRVCGSESVVRITRARRGVSACAIAWIALTVRLTITCWSCLNLSADDASRARIGAARTNALDHDPIRTSRNMLQLCVRAGLLRNPVLLGTMRYPHNAHACGKTR